MARPKLLAAAALLLSVLTGCGEDTEPVSAPTPESSTTAAAAEPRTVPDLAGKSFQDANTLLNSDGLSGVAVGKDGKEWKQKYPYDATVVSSDPAAGSTTEEAVVRLNVDMNESDPEMSPAELAAAKKAAAAAEERAVLAERYDFTCGSTYPYEEFKTLEEVWASASYKDGYTCLVKVDGLDQPEELLPSESAVVAVAKSKGADASVPGSTFVDVLRLCAAVERDYADQVGFGETVRKAWAHAALKLCPKAPHAQLFRDAVTLVRINDGNYVVGKDMQPGTYKTKPGVKDCYWTRNTGGGDIIDNNFVEFAPDGVAVTTYAGEGFESNRCGVWTKIG
jgi:hypothetical protein